MSPEALAGRFGCCKPLSDVSYLTFAGERMLFYIEKVRVKCQSSLVVVFLIMIFYYVKSIAIFVIRENRAESFIV